jgi:hypothetical protein
MSANMAVADWKTGFSLNYANNNPEELITGANKNNNKSLTVTI